MTTPVNSKFIIINININLFAFSYVQNYFSVLIIPLKKMPFEKVIITHKFGIISQSHKKQLQERLLLRRIELENDSKTPKKSDDV
jgi:hypothetical protein